MTECKYRYEMGSGCEQPCKMNIQLTHLSLSIYDLLECNYDY